MKLTDNSKIKTLLVMPFFYPHKGGSQKYAEELHVKIDSLYSQSETDVLCYNTKHSTELEQYKMLTIHRIPCYEIIKDKFLLPKPGPLLKKLNTIKKNNYDFVETHVRFFDASWWAWYFAKKIGAKSIFVGHVPGHPVHHTKFVQLMGRLVDLTLSKWAIRKYDYVYYANKATKKFIEDTLKLKKIGLVAHIGVNPSEFINKQESESRILPNINHKIEPDEILITYVGRMIETKGVLYFLESIKNLMSNLKKEDWKKLVFCFAGPGTLNKELEKRIKKEELSSKVFSLGEITFKQVRSLLSFTNIFVNPSSHDEGLPNTLLEAGASGNLVITTSSGSIEDIIENHNTGIIINKKSARDIEQAITWYLNNKEDAMQIANKLTHNIKENYTWEKAAKLFMNNLI